MVIFGILLPGAIYGQDITVKLGFRDSIRSAILGENRKVLIHLPLDYDQSAQCYPVLYRLDGDEGLLFETVSVVNRLVHWEEVMPDVIVVAIENTDRSRDMWPTHTKYNPAPDVAGSEAFLAFIENELMPHIDSSYRTSKQRILCGQSLSAVFTLYAFLTKPRLFDAYIACSGAFPDCAPYFKALSQQAIQQENLFDGRSLFVTNGLLDELDPEGQLHQEVIAFSETIRTHLGAEVRHRYRTYDDQGHVPFYSLYDGLKFVYEVDGAK